MNTLTPSGSTHARNGHGPSNPFAKALLEAGGSSSTDVALAGIELGTDMITSLLDGGDQDAPSIQGSLRAQLQDAETARTQEIWNSQMQEAQNEEFDSDPDFQRENRARYAQDSQSREVVQLHHAEAAKREQRVQELLIQLKSISETNGAQAQQSQITALQEVQGSAGEYHITFLEKMVRSAVLLRQRTSESQSWISQASTRRASKQDYWSMFHTHGSQWFQSSERSIATSVG